MKQILLKYFEGRASETEQRGLLHYLLTRKGLNEFREYKKKWTDKTTNEPMNRQTISKWKELEKKIQYRDSYNQLKSRFDILKYAAIFLLLIGLTSFYWLYNNERRLTIVETCISTENGQMSKITLPDSSEIWINASSKLTYNNFFGINNRDLSLSGEAYFKVAKREDLPFEVKTGKLKITATGTAFCISAYAQKEAVDVILEEGAVKVSTFENPTNFNVALNPNEMISYNTSTTLYKKNTINPKHYTSWKEGIIHFNKSSLEDILFRLEKRYNQKFSMTDNVRNLHFSLTLHNEDLDEVVEIIEKISNVQSENKSETIHFRLKSTSHPTRNK